MRCWLKKVDVGLAKSGLTTIVRLFPGESELQGTKSTANRTWARQHQHCTYSQVNISEDFKFNVYSSTKLSQYHNLNRARPHLSQPLPHHQTYPSTHNYLTRIFSISSLDQNVNNPTSLHSLPLRQLAHYQHRPPRPRILLKL